MKETRIWCKTLQKFSNLCLGWFSHKFYTSQNDQINLFLVLTQHNACFTTL